MSGGVNTAFSGLSREELEEASSFLVQVNMFRAGSSQEAIVMEDAVKYLRASKFNASKAIEIYKNYQKHRGTYELEAMRPYREPLSFEIGTRKLEIVGSHDPEGAELVVFTGARHDGRQSELKAAMQLLFYTLDQLLESESTQENGVVFIFDMRDTPLEHIKYPKTMLSVLQTGYPVFVKMIYVVGAHMVFKALFHLQKHNKVKFLHFEDLSKYFPEELLPPSLGGVCLPNGHSLSPPQNSPQHRATADAHHNARLNEPAGAVNNLVGIWEDKTGAPTPSSSSSSSSSSSQQSKPLRPKPPSRMPQLSSAKPGAAKLSPHPPPKPAVDHFKPSSDVKGGGASSNFARSPKLVVKQNSADGKSPVGKRAAAALHKQDSASDKLGGSKQPLLPPGAMKSKPVVTGGVTVSSASQGPVSVSVPLTRKTDAVFGKNSSSNVRQRMKQFESAQEKAAHGSKVPAEPVRDAAGREESDSRRFSDSAGKNHSPIRSRGIKGRVPMKILQQDDKVKGVVAQKKSVDRFLRSPEKPLQSAAISNDGSKPPPSGSERAAAERPAYENIVIKPGGRKRSNSDSKAVKLTTAAKLKSIDNYENCSFDEPQSQAPAPPTIAPATSAPPQPAPQKRATYENVEIMTPAGLMTYTTEDSSDEEDTLFGGKPPGMEEVIYENFGPDPGNRLMTVEELGKHMDSKGRKGLSAEYYKIRNEPLRGAYMTCKLPCNVPKNRYKDVICYDDSRVTLKPVPGSEGSDYIHANYVSGYNTPEAFILTQGPIKKTVLDFWRMIWEKQVAIIVMVTKCVELGKRKCEQYWPEEGVCMRYGGVTVELAHTETSSNGSYQLSRFQVHCKGVDRVVHHYQFLAWPDYGLPERGDTVLQMLFDVREARSKLKGSPDSSLRGPPVVVHCSAGVGRSGVFCTLDYSIDELNDQGRVNVQGHVRRIRMQRAYSIQTDEQYEFCFKTLLEYGRTLHSIKR